MPIVLLPDVIFSRYCFYSNWVDVCAFSHMGDACILQMRRSRLGKLKFRVAKCTSWYTTAQAKVSDLPKA